MKFDLISRADAFDLGHKRFYTGEPCKHGHDAQRFVTTGGCVACNAARSKLFADGARSIQKAHRAGDFVYPLHPDDVAAALAYCQALDLARGRLPAQGSFVRIDLSPQSITSPPRGAESITLPDDIARHRQTLIAAYGPKVTAPHIPKP